MYGIREQSERLIKASSADDAFFCGKRRCVGAKKRWAKLFLAFLKGGFLYDQCIIIKQRRTGNQARKFEIKRFLGDDVIMNKGIERSANEHGYGYFKNNG